MGASIAPAFSVMEHRSRLFLVTCLISLNIVTLATPAAFSQPGGKFEHNPFGHNPLTKPASPNNAFSIAQSPASSPSPSPSPASSPSTPSSTLSEWTWWIVLALLPIALVGGVLYGLQRTNRRQNPAKRRGGRSVPLPEANHNLRRRNELGNSGEATHQISENGKQGEAIHEQHPNSSSVESGIHLGRSDINNDLTVSETTRLSRVDIVDELIRDLHSPDSSRRRKAIWELGQRGDSRAVQPLVDLLMDSDSQQRSLILAAVSEIGIRTLKPMNRALLMSVQDDSSEVRKNAIRDVTRVFDLVTQMSQLLQYATSDEDQEVKETAEWALAQLNRIRPLPGTEGLPSLGDRDASKLDAASEPRSEE
jgi:hypothetical protein